MGKRSKVFIIATGTFVLGMISLFSFLGQYSKNSAEGQVKGLTTVITPTNKVVTNVIQEIPTPLPTPTLIPTPTPLPTATPVPATPTPTPEIVYNINPCQGASALCCDGTCSYSAHRSGTCSHHQGVCKWNP